MDQMDQMDLDQMDQMDLDQMDQMDLDQMDQMDLDQMDQMDLDQMDQMDLDVDDELETSPVEVVQHEGAQQQCPPGGLPGDQQQQQRQQEGRDLLQEPGQSGRAAAARGRPVAAVRRVALRLAQQVGHAPHDQSPAQGPHRGGAALHQPVWEVWEEHREENREEHYGGVGPVGGRRDFTGMVH